MAGDFEEFIPLGQVPNLPHIPRRRQGRKLHQATCFRWAQHGIKGIRLRVTKVGGTKCTTLRWLLEFFDALAAVDDSGSP